MVTGRKENILKVKFERERKCKSVKEMRKYRRKEKKRREKKSS